jgi:predicted HTH domain antitoxin
MGTRTLSVEVPDELLALLGSPESAAAKAREALVMELLRDATISQGKAAALLGVGRGELLNLLARYKVPSGPLTAEEWDQEMTVIDRLLEERGRAAGRQQQ